MIDQTKEQTVLESEWSDNPRWRGVQRRAQRLERHRAEVRAVLDARRLEVRALPGPLPPRLVLLRVLL